ncbi:MAG: NB-ARC domain-containing protein [Weeksellaceae bacterium]
MTKLSTGTSHSSRMTSFGTLFKKYRLRSEIETLSEFGDLLADEGIIYENSLFTRWQNGERVPKQRTILIAIVTVFIKRKSIQNISEINEILNSVNQADIKQEELLNIEKYLPSGKVSTLPEMNEILIDREDYIKDISWNLLNKRKVHLYGIPGVGKTSLALYTAHKLTNVFTDGIFWFRSDIKTSNDIFKEIFSILGVSNFKSNLKENNILNLKLLLKDRKVLLIFDNLNENVFKNELSIFFDLEISILSTSITSFNNNSYNLRIEPFNEQEFFKFAEKILSKPFFQLHIVGIKRIGEALGYLPITVSICLKQIYDNPSLFKKYANSSTNEFFSLKEASYDRKNLEEVLQLNFDSLSMMEKKTLLGCASFDGGDFSLSTLANLINIKKEITKKHIKGLVKVSFLQSSIRNRYKLHPAIKAFLIQKVEENMYEDLSQIYIESLKKHPPGSSQYLVYVANEYENIKNLLKKNYFNNNFNFVVNIWSLISTYIFYSGKWEDLIVLDKWIQRSYLKLDDIEGLGLYLCEDLGRIYFYQNRIEMAIKVLAEAEQLANLNNNFFLKALVIQKYGIVNSLNENYLQAEEQLTKSLKNLNKKKYMQVWVMSKVYLGMIYIKTNRYKKGISYLNMSLSKSNILSDINIVTFSQIYLAQGYLYLNNYRKAKKLFENAYKDSTKINNKIGQLLSLKGLGVIYLNSSNNALAEKVLLKALNLATDLNMHKDISLIKKNLKECQVNFQAH